MKKSTKIISAVIAGAAILIGGIWMINESRYPNAPAFDDHFTREFLDKDQKVDDGFYEFKSKTGQYTMWFPGEYQLLHKDREDYAINNDSYENWWAVYNEEVEDEIQKNYIKTEFSTSNPTDESIHVEALFKRRFGLSNPKQIDTSKTRIYYQSAYIYFKGTEKQVISDRKKHIPNTYLAYVADKSSNKILQISFDNSGKYKSDDEEKKKAWFVKILKSIRFNEENNNE
ncbi:hypothetical protein [Priestia megaterium]|uniref:hypothetical protein n=1 Tax=Priestia megaterium TaxID=1404 RepID=UPI0006ABB63C|nr:hypothetical protein [Priestia megaterium]KOP70429.1 hypothetical protein AMS61_27600 [Bacillus sp. FJAT-21351]USL39662.1 hypothetical protein LIT34_30835 [Priestia megaterium]